MKEKTEKAYSGENTKGVAEQQFDKEIMVAMYGLNQPLEQKQETKRGI